MEICVILNSDANRLQEIKKYKGKALRTHVPLHIGRPPPVLRPRAKEAKSSSDQLLVVVEVVFSFSVDAPLCCDPNMEGIKFKRLIIRNCKIGDVGLSLDERTGRGKAQIHDSLRRNLVDRTLACLQRRSSTVDRQMIHRYSEDQDEHKSFLGPGDDQNV